MVATGKGELRGLAEWQPPLGVLSVYLGFDPDDRGGAWRTELRNGLREVETTGGLDHDGREALRATVSRIEERFANHDRDLPRGEAGFVEVAPRKAAEYWWSSRVEPGEAPPVILDRRPLVAPLIHMSDRAAPCGAALLSAERVRLLQSQPGGLTELRDWELEIFSRDWRERKAQRVPDPAVGQAVSASGRDQYDERLEENRRHFLGECGRLATAVAADAEWKALLVFGAPEQRRDFVGGMPDPALASTGDGADLVSGSAQRRREHIEAASELLRERRQQELTERTLDRADSGIRGASGVRRVTAALGEARVEELVLDAADAVAREALVRAALGSGAAVSPVDGEAAELLAPADGLAATLRY